MENKKSKKGHNESYSNIKNMFGSTPEDTLVKYGSLIEYSGFNLTDAVRNSYWKILRLNLSNRVTLCFYNTLFHTGRSLFNH